MLTFRTVLFRCDLESFDLVHNLQQYFTGNGEIIRLHAPVPMKLPWRIWWNKSYEFNDKASATNATGIILWMRPANERRRYIVTSSLIGWAHNVTTTNNAQQTMFIFCGMFCTTLQKFCIQMGSKTKTPELHKMDNGSIAMVTCIIYTMQTRIIREQWTWW